MSGVPKKIREGAAAEDNGANIKEPGVKDSKGGAI
jgi:hypothetical protein